MPTATFRELLQSDAAGETPAPHFLLKGMGSNGRYAKSRGNRISHLMPRNRQMESDSPLQRELRKK